VLFNWPAEQWRDFYFRMADEAALDTVVVGEIVCEKRLPFNTPYIPEVIERLQRAGKQVMVASLGLISSERERSAARALLDIDGVLVEANDISVAAALAGQPHAIGPMINIYNEGTLTYLAERGAVRVCLPPELSGKSIAALAMAAETELEVQVFGRIPLAISARCYHARSRGLGKDGCQYVCADDADGMVIDTLEAEPFLAVNGTQTLSFSYLNLSAELAMLRSMGVHRFRLSPQDVDMVAVATVFDALLNDRLDADEADDKLHALCADTPFSNGFFHAREGRIFIGQEIVAE